MPYSTIRSGINRPQTMSAKTMVALATLLDVSQIELSESLHAQTNQKIRKELIRKRDMRLKGNVYHRTTISMAYNSNKIEGGTLTEDQTLTLFDQDSIGIDDKDVKLKDMIEVKNHFTAFNHMLDTANSALSHELLFKCHKILMAPTDNEDLVIGGYKSMVNSIGMLDATKPEDVRREMNELFAWYKGKKVIDLNTIIEFHYRLECIHPFQDGNGRIGRIIVFKECLRHNITPLVITNEYRSQYINGLKKYSSNKVFLEETFGFHQDRYVELIKKMLPKFEI